MDEGVTTDLALIGQAFSNGVPLSAIVGKDQYMSKLMDADLPAVHGGNTSYHICGHRGGFSR